MTILGYPVIGQVKANGRVFPLAGIPMMSDEEWGRISRENAINNYIREQGHKPENADAAIEWQREWLEQRRAGV